MQNKWKTTKLYQKIKDIRVDRAVVLSVVVILLSLTMVLAVTVATNRAKKQTGTETEITDAPSTNTPATDDRPTGTAPQPSEESVPEMSLPTSGKLAKKHSVDVQVFSQTMQDFRAHLGIDIATAAGAEVFAPADGTLAAVIVFGQYVVVFLNMWLLFTCFTTITTKRRQAIEEEIIERETEKIVRKKLLKKKGRNEDEA